MSKISKKQVEQIINFVGGSGNIASVSHCLTRLRFVLNDTKLANKSELEALSLVKGCFTNAGQFQVVVGTEVDEVYAILLSLTGKQSASKDESKQAARKNMNVLERGISHLAEIFVPLLPAIITGGLILGFRNLIGDIKMFDGHSLTEISQFWATAHSFLWLIGEAIFFYLPVGVCWSTVKKLGGTPILGITLGITLVSPQLMNAYLIGKQVPQVWDFGWFTIQQVGYQAQVIPAVLAGVVLALIETNLKKIVPAYLYLVVVPFVSLVLAVLLAHAIIGPIGRDIGNAVGAVAKAAMTGDFRVVGSMIFGFLYAPLVITGIHHTTNAVDLQLMQELGGTPIWPLIALSNIAQASAVTGIIIISKKHGERDISVPAAISAYLGVTEPAMYGINLKYKFPMLSAMLGSALAAGVCGVAGVMANGIGVGGLPGILSIQPQFWGVYALAMLVAIIAPIVFTIIFYKRAEAKGQLEQVSA
ncbi:PTS trehalose transporter subunit IIBC [Vibrio sp. S4M6]|uniref:PTS trehalose transporter subunit IIBC n=1 Tax=Vibrio sinus TaxID=2946865 RepID=UPI00202A4B00|nr:PTS trehalose transporter subunit IIBC [Vibrio sinus]